MGKSEGTAKSETAGKGQTVKVTLSGDNEVPPVKTKATEAEPGKCRASFPTGNRRVDSRIYSGNEFEATYYDQNVTFT